MTHERLSIPLARLRLNTENDRHGPLSSEYDCIQWMLTHHGKEIRNLAKDIASHGLSPIDGVLVLPYPEIAGDYVVWEGNRRVTALKLIDDPNRCPDAKLRRKFVEIRGKARVSIPTDIECIVASSMEDAERLIELRHQGPQDGVGTLQWDAQQKSRHLQRLGKTGRYDFTHQVIDAFVDKLNPDLREKVTAKGFRISTLDRLLRNPDVREFLGISNEDGVPRRFLRESETLKGLTRMLGDIADGMPVGDVYNKKQQKKYIDGFPPESRPDPTRTIKDSRPLAKSRSVPDAPRTRQRPLSHKRNRLIPTEVRYAIKDTRLRAIFRELRELDLKEYRNSVAVLFRVFVELSIELYLDSHAIEYSTGDKLFKKASKAAVHMKEQGWAEKDVLKGINAACSSPNNPLSFHTFNAYVHNRHFHPSAPDLATAWDNVQPFLDVLYERLN